MNRSLSIILLMIVAVTQSALSAQSTVRNNRVVHSKLLVSDNLSDAEILDCFRVRFSQLDSLLGNMTEVIPPSVGVRSVTKEMLQSDSLFSVKTKDEIAALRSNTGLEITGQTYARLDEMLVNDATDDDEAVSRYNVKAQAELGWNIINSRFYQGREKYRRVTLANELDRLLLIKQMSAGIYDEAVETLTAIYNRYIAVVIANRLENLDIINTANQYLLEKDRISNDRLLDVMTDKMEAEYQLSLLGTNVDVKTLPLGRIVATQVAVDTVALSEAIAGNSDDARILKVREDIIDNESTLTNYLSTVRLTPFVRWSSYWRNRISDVSNNADVGVRFTVPLHNDSDRKRRALATEKRLVRAEAESDMAKLQSRCMTHVRQVESYNRAIAMEQAHIEQISRYMDMRRNAYNNREASGYNYVMRLQEYNEYLKSMERMYRLTLNRTVAIISIMEATGFDEADMKKIFTEVSI